jgi:hypothetical protein
MTFNREKLKAAGYEVYQHFSHGGTRWGYMSPLFGESHLSSEDVAWNHAELRFTQELERAAQIMDLVLPRNSIEGLRELRLWHWSQVVMNRQLAASTWQKIQARDLPNEPWIRKTARAYDRNADTHLKFVQVLNDFFPVGDTAENDAAKR